MVVHGGRGTRSRRARSCLCPRRGQTPPVPGTPPPAKRPWWLAATSERGAAALTSMWVLQLVLAIARVAGDVAAASPLDWAVLGLSVLLVAGHAATWVHLRRTRLARYLAGHTGP